MIQKTSRDRPHVSAGTVCIFVLAAIVAVCDLPSPAVAADACEPAFATVVSVQGGVEVRRPSSAVWQQVRLNDPICAGDTLRVGELGRAGLLLSNETTLRLDQNTTLTLAVPEKEQPSLLDLVSGVIHVISRTPRPFRVRNQYLNAAVQGTEFLVGVVEGSARVAVFEGRVTAENELGSVTVGAGEQAIAAKGSAPRKEVLVRPKDAVQWTLYFPAIFDYSVEAAAAPAPGDSALQESVELYRKGRLADAIRKLQSVPEGLPNARFLVYRAGLLLLVGRLDEARADIGQALALDPRAADAYALQAVIAVVQNDKDEALKLADKAVEVDPASPAARIALSYVEQAHFHIEEARAAAQKAVDLDPRNALAWARLAEMQMSVGDLDRALDAAKHAAALDPDLAKTQAVLGFAYLLRIDTPAAKAAFDRAIELSQADPLPRLGLGLAIIREGDLKGGREQIEIAASLDPDRSLIRSYLGKAYYEERRDKLAETQYDQAKERDRLDPTPWLYGALLELTENRLVEAFQDAEESIELNENREVYRSRLLLDEDRATRSAGLARIYRELGFEELAVIEGARALAVNFRNDAAHLFTADAYSPLPKEDIARQSEELQFLLRQREIISPVSALRLDDAFAPGFPRTGIVKAVSPEQPAFNEFNSLFDRNKVSLYVDGIGGEGSTAGEQVIGSGIHDALSFNLAQAHFETQGFDENQNFRQNAYLGLIQDRLDPATSVQAELRQTDTRRGVSVFVDPTTNFPLQLNTRVRSGRLGGNHSFSEDSDIVLSTIYQTRDVDILQTPGGLKQHAYSGETQWSYSIRPLHVLVGGGHVQGSEDFVGAPKEYIAFDNVYAYGNIELNRIGLITQAGLSAEFLRDTTIQKRQVSPKLGLMWSPTSETTLRAAFLRALKRPLVANQTIEPTQLAGFVQFADDLDSTRALTYCVGLDQRLVPDTHVGLEFRRRSLQVPFVPGHDAEWHERDARAYIYWPIPRDTSRSLFPDWAVAVTAEIQNQKRERPVEDTGDENIVSLNGTFVPVGLTIFPARYLSIKWVETHVRQTGSVQSAPVFTPLLVDQDFWLADLSVEYRIPGRRGIVAVGGSNLFSRKFPGYQEVDPANARFAQGRLLFARLIWQF